ncbi:MAG: hypothetical protein P8174_12380 [Gemmatimonadota bacterium]
MSQPAGELAWSPDGQWIAFTTVYQDQQDLYVIRSDGTGLLRLTNDAALDSSPAWR